MDHVVETLRVAVLEGPADTTSELRRSAADDTSIDPSLASFVAKVRRHAYRVTDAEIVALRASGLTEDAIFELTAAAALGAALVRLHAGLRAIGEEP
jgi:alkylhydroperoxidase family enzyme